MKLRIDPKKFQLILNLMDNAPFPSQSSVPTKALQNTTIPAFPILILRSHRMCVQSGRGRKKAWGTTARGAWKALMGIGCAGAF